MDDHRTSGGMTAHRTNVQRYTVWRWSCQHCDQAGEGYPNKWSAQQDADAHELEHGGPATRPRVFVISSADMGRCPVRSILPGHYHDGGSCRCDEDRRVTWAGR